MKIFKSIVIIGFILASLIISCIDSTQPVIAAGNTTITINCAAAGGYSWLAANAKTWDYYREQPADTLTGKQVGFERSTAHAHVYPYSGTFSWDISAIPSDAEIVSVSIITMPTAKYDTYMNYDDFYMAYFKDDWGSNGIIDAVDNGRWKLGDNAAQNYVSAPFKFSDCTVGVEHEIELNASEALDTYAGGNMVYLRLATVNLYAWSAPVITGEAAGARIRMDVTGSAGTYPKLEVTYVSSADDRLPDLHTNAAVDTETLGTETADNITLETLKCMYADETLSFLINGDSGANVTMELLAGNGEILETHSDSIRTDSIYSWQINLDSDYSGFVRVHETVFDLWSNWVSVQPSPSLTQMNNQVYAADTSYPQYTNSFSQYVVYDDGLMYVHWKTNIDPAAELADYSLQLLSNGNTDVYCYTLESMGDYFGGTTANLEKLAHWRYAVFSPAIASPGFNDYGGIVQDLDFDSKRTLRTGFIQAHIVESADNVTELAGTHSAYWYLSAVSKGLSIGLESSAYTDIETPVISFSVGSECKAEIYLPTGTITADGDTYFNVVLGSQSLVIPSMSTIGSNTVSVVLTGDHTYVYRYDMPLTIVDDDDPGGTGIDVIDDPNNILGLLKKIFGFINADTPAEKWIWLIVGMGLLVALFWFNSLLRVVMPMLLFGAACVSEWIDPWWVVLLALGAGVYMFSLFKKKTGESDG